MKSPTSDLRFGEGIDMPRYGWYTSITIITTYLNTAFYSNVAQLLGTRYVPVARYKRRICRGPNGLPPG